MRTLALTALALILTACGTTAQRIEATQTQDGVRLTMFTPTWDCHVHGDLASDASNIAWRASEACSENRIIPFEIIEVDTGNHIYDGGVYAHNVTVWPVQQWPGEYRVVHGQHGGLIATVEVP